MNDEQVGNKIDDVGTCPGLEQDKGHGTVTSEEALSQRSGLHLRGLAMLCEGTMLDEKALAECLGTSPRTLRRMVRRGEIPQGIKLGGRRLWVVGKVREYLAEQADRLADDAKRIARHFATGRV